MVQEFLQVIIPGKAVFLRNGPVIRIAVAEIAVCTVEEMLNGVLFPAMVPEKIAVCLPVLVRRPDPLRVGGGGQERETAGAERTSSQLIFRFI